MASGVGMDTIELATTNSLKMEEPMITMRQLQVEDEDKFRNTSSSGKVASMEMSASGAAQIGQSVGTRHRSEKDKERKIGHRRVGVGGEITYKKIQTTQIMGSIQLGIQHAVGSLASKPERDLLMQDFMTLESTNFPHEGSNHTPAHHYSEFRFKNYAPIAFRYFRDLFGIQPDDFLMSMCSSPLRELSNPGASGSIFYLTEDDEFIIKTVQHKEGEFLQKLLPGYYMNLNQNPRTLLPKFFGLYCYQCNSKNVRLVAMNNLLPSYVKLHQKYDLKGSTYKRKASKSERGKKSPTFKDLDFMDQHPEGLFLEAETYSALVKTIQRDCRVLESFKIMDYSLLVGVHNLDIAQKEKAEEKPRPSMTPRGDELDGEDYADNAEALIAHERERDGLNRSSAKVDSSAVVSRSINRQRLVAHSTAMESIQAESEPIDEEEDVPPGGIPARSARGERLLLFIGVIDILQSYRLKKKLEHTWKSIIHDGDTVSVHRPGFYAQRFQDFMARTVFKKIPSPLKHSPSKRKSISRVATRSNDGDSDNHSNAFPGTSNIVGIKPATASSLTTAPPSAPPIATSTPRYRPNIATSTNNPSNRILATVANGKNSKNGEKPNGQESRANSVKKNSATHSQIKSVQNVTGNQHFDTVEHKSELESHELQPNSVKPGDKFFDTFPAVLKGVQQKVPPPVPPRGSPKSRRSTSNKQGAAPSCCSTPPPAFDDVLHGHPQMHSSHLQSPVSMDADGRRTHSMANVTRTTFREETVSISEIRLDSRNNLSGDGSSGRGLTWTPPASVEGSTPTWTEGTPSFTESSSSGDMGCPATPSKGNIKPSVEEALNSLTSEMMDIPMHFFGKIKMESTEVKIELLQSNSKA